VEKLWNDCHVNRLESNYLSKSVWWSTSEKAFEVADLALAANGSTIEAANHRVSNNEFANNLVESDYPTIE